ncbi:major facilitator superfamily transporter maltose permease [Niveomyces insectorum RCEF 264]|uniref:Major facilitator superfamily transporter maltose permease n=1 Tax=Niveomyces insectorum RCEF 264 TaxID=1081102 RepID=A0A167XZ31_9HYPO|nr:major facilitator superfamily transporter maltose permease [Niveomyces insectorum RCEF 264]
MAGALFMYFCFSFINVFAPSMQWIIAGTLLQGLPCGGFATLASSYISDVCPASISEVLTGLISCCWVTGQLCAYGILWSVVGREGASAYRIPMAMQWIIPLPVAIGCVFAPPSPWWLARRGSIADAFRSLQRLSSSPCPLPSPASPATATTSGAVLRLAEIRRVILMEENERHVGTSFKDCFRRIHAGRTEVAIMVNIGQIIVGFSIASQLVNFMRLAGLQSDDSIEMAFFNAIVLLSGNVLYFLLHIRLSVRTVYVSGLVFIWPVLLLIGVLEALKRSGAIHHQVGATIGPATNTIVCGVSSAALRTKTLALSRMANDLVNLAQAAAGPYMLSQENGNLQGFAAFPATGLVAIWIFWAFIRFPETKGISQDIVDDLFQRSVPARKFKTEARLQLLARMSPEEANAYANDTARVDVRGSGVELAAAETGAY